MGNIAKCDFCRRDKKKCTWPPKPASISTLTQTELPDKCDWCIKFRFPCSKRRRANEIVTNGNIPKTLAPRLEFRPTIDIIRDFDCILYLIAGILEYGDHHIKTTSISKDWEDFPLESNFSKPESFRTVPSPLWIPQTNSLAYRDSTSLDSTDVLRQNLEKFHTLRGFCKRGLEAEFEKLQKEANAVLEYLTSKKRSFEAAALINILATPPKFYTTKSIEIRNAHRKDMNSPYLATLIESEKNCGQLFLHIKALMVPSVRGNILFTSTIQYGDIKHAQEVLHKLIEGRFMGSPIQATSTTRELIQMIYHRIDPLERRACFLKEDNCHIQYGSHIAAAVSQEKLLGETSVRIARNHNPNNTKAAVAYDKNLGTAGDIAVDIRGVDIVLALILDGPWDLRFVDILRHPTWPSRSRDPRKAAFFSDTEVPGLQNIRKAFPNPYMKCCVHLDAYQLATLKGDLPFIKQLQAVIPHLFTGIYTLPAANADDSMFQYLKFKDTVPEPIFGEYHPVVLSALAGYVDITRHYLEGNPVLSKLQSDGGTLETLFLIAFKRDDLELLSLLNEVALIELDSSKRIVLSHLAAEFASSSMFHTWMNLVWFDLSGLVWGAGATGSVRCHLWRTILSSIRVRYEDTQGIQNQEIQSEKAQFIEVIWAMEGSTYLARCVCRGCQESYMQFLQTLGS